MYLYDLFICHASEDKDSFVRPLAEALRQRHVEVWYDEFSLKLGDSIRRSLDKGLRQSRFGVVVLTKSFFEKQWPQYELDGLAELEMKGRDKVILPVWHGITHDDVMRYSPSLAGRKAASSSLGIVAVTDEIFSVIHPEGSPLLMARDILLDRGIIPPVITDQYWLSIVEASNRVPGFGFSIPEEASWDRWSFPLPSKEGGSMAWGERLAWTAMQMNWVKAANETPITPLTPPSSVHRFLHSYPGLLEVCQSFPDLAVEYAPQLTIPGYEGDLETVIEQSYRRSCDEAKYTRVHSPRSGSALTTNRRSPQCDKEWALRHPTFGNYQSIQVAYAYFHGGMFGPHVSPYEDADHTFWLLSSASSWLPASIHTYLLEGTARHMWLWGYGHTDEGGSWESNGALAEALYESLDGKPFKWTEARKHDLLNRIELSVETLKLPERPETIQEHFLANKIVSKLIQAQRKLKEKHSRAGSDKEFG